MFVQQGATLLPSYLAVTRADFHAAVEPVDFTSSVDAAAATQTIDAWVAAHTDGAVPELFPAGSLTNLTRLVVANAIAFKGTWAERFDPSATVQGGAFTLASGGAA